MLAKQRCQTLVGHSTDYFLKSVSRPVKIETALVLINSIDVMFIKLYSGFFVVFTKPTKQVFKLVRTKREACAMKLETVRGPSIKKKYTIW
jgi:hypothetical protein